MERPLHLLAGLDNVVRICLQEMSHLEPEPELERRGQHQLQSGKEAFEGPLEIPPASFGLF